MIAQKKWRGSHRAKKYTLVKMCSLLCVCITRNIHRVVYTLYGVQSKDNQVTKCKAHPTRKEGTYHVGQIASQQWPLKNPRTIASTSNRQASIAASKHPPLPHCCHANKSVLRPQPASTKIMNLVDFAQGSLTRVTKSYLLALGTTQISSYFTKH